MSPGAESIGCDRLIDGQEHLDERDTVAVCRCFKPLDERETTEELRDDTSWPALK